MFAACTAAAVHGLRFWAFKSISKDSETKTDYDENIKVL